MFDVCISCLSLLCPFSPPTGTLKWMIVSLLCLLVNVYNLNRLEIHQNISPEFVAQRRWHEKEREETQLIHVRR